MTTLTRQLRNFIDIDFAFTKHPITTNVGIRKDINAIKQSVINLLTLREGDKPFHPEIKSPIYPYLFDNFTVISKIVLEDEINRYLTALEPRVKITSVNVSLGDPNTINCIVNGDIINLSEPFSVSILIDRLR